MHERQIYVDDTSRTRAFAGSVGTLNDEYMLRLAFDALIVERISVRPLIEKITPTDKSIVLDLYLADDGTYEDRNDSSTYAWFDDEDPNILHLSYHYDDTSYEFGFMIDGLKITMRHSAIRRRIPIDVNGVTYRSKYSGYMFKYKHSKFIDKNGELCETFIEHDPITLYAYRVASKDNICTYVDKIEAIRQYLMQHLAIMKHELWYNYEYGLPIMQNGLTKAMIDAEVALVISECPGIDSITSFESTVDDTHNYHLSFSLMTIYGKLELIDTL